MGVEKFDETHGYMDGHATGEAMVEEDGVATGIGVNALFNLPWSPDPVPEESPEYNEGFLEGFQEGVKDGIDEAF